MADAGRVSRPGLKVLFITEYAESAGAGNGVAGAGDGGGNFGRAGGEGEGFVERSL